MTCARCPIAAKPDDTLCQACRDRDHDRRCALQRRLLRRENQLCADCGVIPSSTYRCEDCAAAKKLRSCGISQDRRLGLRSAG